MKKNLILLKIFIVLLFYSSDLFASLQNKIIVKIENQAVTSYELKNKIKTILLISGEEVNQANINKIKSSAVNALINIRLKQIELSKFNIKINENLLTDQLNRVTSNKLGSFKKQLKENDLSYDIFEKEVEVELKWQKLIFSIYNKKVAIGSSIIEKDLKPAKFKQFQSIDFKLSEIEILLNDDKDKLNAITDIKKRIKEIGFEKTALQISISSSAIDKGDLGWLNSKTMTKKIFDIVSKLNIGEISEPIINPNSILFLKLSDKKNNDTLSADKQNYKDGLIKMKKTQMYNLYSSSHLSKIKNNSLIEYK